MHEKNTQNVIEGLAARFHIEMPDGFRKTIELIGVNRKNDGKLESKLELYDEYGFEYLEGSVELPEEIDNLNPFVSEDNVESDSDHALRNKIIISAAIGAAIVGGTVGGIRYYRRMEKH